jgi:hypothetical protein
MAFLKAANAGNGQKTLLGERAGRLDEFIHGTL